MHVDLDVHELEPPELDARRLRVHEGVLVLRGTGRVPNPTGGTALTRTVTDKIE